MVCESAGSVNRRDTARGLAGSSIAFDSCDFADGMWPSATISFLLSWRIFAFELWPLREELWQSGRTANNAATGDFLNRDGPRLAHDGAKFAAQNFQHGLDAGLAKSGQPPGVGSPYADR